MAELGGFSSALRLALCDCDDVHKFEPLETCLNNL